MIKQEVSVTWDELLASVLISDANTLGLAQIFLAMIYPFILAFPLAWVYRYVQKNNNFSSSFIMSLFLFATLSSVMTILIGNNIARAFGLIGALSIIRFRSALKDPLDAVFIFWSLAIGMASGTGYYLLAAATCILCSAMMVLLKAIGVARPKYFDSVLKVVADSRNKTIDSQIENTLRHSKGRYEKMNEYFDNMDDKKTYVYTLRRAANTDLSHIENSLKNIEGVKSIAHLNKESSLFLENRH